MAIHSATQHENTIEPNTLAKHVEKTLATKSSNKILRIIQLLHLQLNITRAKVFGSIVFILMYVYFHSHTSSVERFSENFDQEAVTHLIFFLGTH